METNTDNQVQAAQSETSAAPKNALERCIDFSIALNALEKETDERLRRTAHNAKLPGFRPGKAPLKVIKQQFGYQTRNEVLNEMIERAFNEAVRAQQLHVAGYPRIEPKKDSVDTDGSLEFLATFEVFPEFEMADMSKETVHRVSLEIGDAQIDQTIEVLRKQRVHYEDTDRAAEQGDRVLIGYSGTIDGNVFDGGKGDDVHLLVGDGMMLPEFESNIIGLKAHEIKEFELTFPEDYHDKEVAGKVARFTLTLKAVQAPVLPDVDTGFAKMLGIADGDTIRMRAEVTESLKREVKRRLGIRNKNAVMDMLLRTHPIDLPNVLVDTEIKRLMQNMAEDMQARGIMTKKLDLRPEWFLEQARRRVALGLIVAQLVKVKALNAKPEQIKAMVEEIAQSYEDPKEVVSWYYGQRDRLAEIEAVVLEDNVVDWIYNNVQIEDKTIVFDELMGRQ